MIRKELIAISIACDAQIILLGNSISQSGQGIVFTGGPAPVDPPTITSADSGSVAGTCTGKGDVQAFADPDDQGELVLGWTACNAGTWSVIPSTSVPSSYHFTATFTDVVTGRTSGFSARFPP